MNLSTAMFLSFLNFAFANGNLEMFDLSPMSPARMERVRQFIATLNAKAVAELAFVANIGGIEVKIEHPPSIAELNEGISFNLYEGDILLSDEQLESMETGTGAKGTRQKRTAFLNAVQKWDVYKPIPYRFNSNLSVISRKAALYAMDEITKKTCLTFLESPKGTYGVEFFDGVGCLSNLGQVIDRKNQTKWQPLYLHKLCGTAAIAVHEITHALGSHHTHTRFDRDEYVTVNTRNILEEKLHNFEKQKEEDNTNPVPFDYGSIMQYSPTDFAINESVPALAPNDMHYIRTMGRHHFAVAFSDWKAICAIYNCSRWCDTPVQCKNGGYADPHSCKRCECPEFFNGVSCENVVTPVSVESTKLLRYSEPREDAVLASSSAEFEEYDKSPPYLVTGPEGSKLKLTFSGYSSSLKSCEQDCITSGAEIVDGDLTMVGKTFCCKEDVGLNFVSKSNKVGVKFYNKPGFVVSLNVTVDVVSSS